MKALDEYNAAVVMLNHATEHDKEALKSECLSVIGEREAELVEHIMNAPRPKWSFIEAAFDLHDGAFIVSTVCFEGISFEQYCEKALKAWDNPVEGMGRALYEDDVKRFEGCDIIYTLDSIAAKSIDELKALYFGVNTYIRRKELARADDVHKMFSDKLEAFPEARLVVNKM